MSDESWYGKLPSHWDAGNIRRFASMKTGHTPSRQHTEYWIDCTIPWFTLADVWQLRAGARELGETSERISELGLANSAAELLPAGTVVLSRTASVGFSGIMPVPMATSQDFWNWVPKPGMLSRFLWYQLQSMKPEFERLMMGSTHRTIYQGDAASLRIVAPPIGEQRAIADYLDRETAQIGTFIAKNEELITLLTERRAASIDRVMAEHDESRLRLKYRLEANTGGVWGDDPTGADDTVVLRSTEQTVEGHWRIESPALRALSRADARRFRLREGDLLVTKSSGSEAHIGKATLVDATVAALAPAYSNFMQRLTPSSAMNPKFLWYVLRSRAVRDQLNLMTTSTTGLGNLNGGILGDLHIPAPTLEKQVKTVAELDRAFYSVNAAISCANDAAALARERRAALISAAVSGKIDVGVAA